MYRLMMPLVLMALAGCAVGGAGSLGEDSLPEVQLGDDPVLDADVAAITAARNEALVCLGEEGDVEEADMLLALKQGYVDDPAGAATFPQFVAQFVEPERSRADEICQTTLDNASAELLAQIQRLTTARIRGAQCEGTDANLTDETSLERLKLEFFGTSIRAYPTLTDFAEAFVEDFEQVVDDLCAG